MKIAFDGGAFQQHIAGGILNAQVGIINAACAASEDFTFILVADPRLGPVRDELLALLTTPPETIVYGEVGPAYGPSTSMLTTDDARVRFEVDGRIVEPRREGDGLVYRGPAPKLSFYINSRADRPSVTRSGPDTRVLGIAIRAITISSDGVAHPLSMKDTILDEGFQGPEKTLRWTTGRAKLPLSLFRHEAESIEVIVDVAGTMTYRVAEGAYDKVYSKIAKRMKRSTLAINSADLESKLLKLGAEFYCVNHFIPATFRSLKSVAILYDLVPILFPTFFFKDAQENFDYNLTVFKNAEHVFSISEASRADLLRIGSVPPERVTTIGLDVAAEFKPQSNEKIAAARARCGIAHDPYVICVATLEPRKNHARLIKAFHKATEGGERKIDLVLVGKHGWGTGDVVSLIGKLGLTDRVKLLHDVSNLELAALYGGAAFLAYPSLYEGFGLPLLEAMACGCPVLTSNVASMPEIAGAGAYFVDPSDTDSIAKGLRAMIADENLRDQLAERGLIRRRDFNWETSATRMIGELTRLGAGSRSCA